MKVLLSSLILLTATVAQAEFCASQAKDAAIAINQINFPNKTVVEATSTFTHYSGYHVKQYQVSITDSNKETNAYAVNVFEYESADTECVIDSVVRAK